MFGRKASRRVLLVIIGTLMAGLALESTVLAAALVRSGGPVTAIQTATATYGQVTSSTSGQTMPGMSVNVMVPQGEQALLIVTFSAEALCYGAASATCLIRARVDGQTISPGEVKFDSPDDGNSVFEYEANSMQFVAGPVGAGQHTIDIRWRTDSGSIQFAVEQRTLTVLRSKV